MSRKIQLRRDTAANWTTFKSIVLADGEVGLDTTNKLVKIGDGTTTWEFLYYYGTTTTNPAQVGLKDVQDDVAAMFTDDIGCLDFTYNDTTGKIEAELKSGVIVDGYISGSAAITWSKINKSGAIASEVGAEPTLAKGNLTESTSSVLTISSGTAAVIGSGTTIQVLKASSSQDGYLSSTDWSTFNSGVIDGGAAS